MYFRQQGEPQAAQQIDGMASMLVLTTASIDWATRPIPAWFRWRSYFVGELLLLAATFQA